MPSIMPAGKPSMENTVRASSTNTGSKRQLTPWQPPAPVTVYHVVLAAARTRRLTRHCVVWQGLQSGDSSHSLQEAGQQLAALYSREEWEKQSTQAIHALPQQAPTSDSWAPCLPHAARHATAAWLEANSSAEHLSEMPDRHAV